MEETRGIKMREGKREKNRGIKKHMGNEDEEDEKGEGWRNQAFEKQK